MHLEKALHAAQSASDLQLLHSNWGAVLMHTCVSSAPSPSSTPQQLTSTEHRSTVVRGQRVKP